MKKCPFCAEDIKKEAKKCKHCWEFLEDDKLWKKEIKTESKKEKYEYITKKIYRWLNLYLKYLPYFWWEILSNQKINYWSTWKSDVKLSQWMFWSTTYSWANKENITHHYYNELSLKRNKNEVEKELLDNEIFFFAFINKSLNSTTYWYIKITIIAIIVFYISVSLLIKDNSFLLVLGSIWIGLIGLYIWESSNNKIRQWNKYDKPELIEKYWKMFKKYWYKI